MSDLEVTATLTSSTHQAGEQPVGWWCEIDDPASPIAGLTAAGPTRDAALTALAREVWTTVADGTAGVSPRTVTGVVIAATTRVRVPCAQLPALTVATA